MKLGVPWRVKGIRPDARETAREAARRAGMSVGEWLNTVIIDSAEEATRPPRARYEEDEEENDRLFAVHERLDQLTRRLERLPRTPAARPPYAPAAQGPEAYAPPSYAQDRERERDNKLADAIARLDQRMDDLVNASRSAAAAPVHVPAPPPYVPTPSYPPDSRAAAPADVWTPDIDRAMAEINARMRALDADPVAPAVAQRRSGAEASRAMPPQPQAPAAAVPSQNLDGLEQHLRQITSQIQALRRQPELQDEIAGLRQALSEIARTLLDAMPKRAIEALEGEVRALAARLDTSRQAGVDSTTLGNLESGLSEILGALRNLRPAENLDVFREAVHSLAQKIDLLGSSAPDANAFRQLESAVSAMQGIVSHVASNEALAQLSGEVRALAGKIDQVAASDGRDHRDALETLDRRVAHIADALESRVQNGGSMPPQLETLIQGLIEKIERLQHSRIDEDTVGNLETSIAALVEKLDSSGARISQLEAIERGLADLLMHIEKQQNAPEASAAPQMEGLQRDLVRTQTSLDAVHGTLGQVVDRLAMLESDVREAQTQPQAQQPQLQPPPQVQPQVQPAELQLPPEPEAEPEPEPELEAETESPLPPAAQRDMPTRAEPPVFAPEPPPVAPPPSREIAHAQAAAAMARANPKSVRPPIDPNLPPDQPLEPGSNPRGRLTASPADRIAASEAALGPVNSTFAESDNKSNFIAAARRAARAAATEPTTADLRAAATPQLADDNSGKGFAQRMRSFFAGVTVLLIGGGALYFGSTLIDFGDETPSIEIAGMPVPNQAEGTPPASEPEPETAALPSAPGAEIPFSPDMTGSLPASALPSVPPSQLSTRQLTPPPLASTLPSTRPASRADKLPAVIGGPALREAAAAGDAAAEYEVGLRYVEGRGVAANPTEAARWLELAASQGLAMAQVRLAGLYEKGIGVKKDAEIARRHYKAAAEQGNAKAMHNLAVLYAEGAAVKPDYRTAAQWFRLAADHGVADSQYNLGILYTRGIGVDRNLIESYKWFALAADQGDQEAEKKRDEVAKRLDPGSLATAKLAVRAFVPQPQPEAATAVKLPPGGWDAAASQPTDGAPGKPKRNATVRVGSR
jgi:localization factor PodJL